MFFYMFYLQALRTFGSIICCCGVVLAIWLLPWKPFSPRTQSARTNWETEVWKLLNQNALKILIGILVILKPYSPIHPRRSAPGLGDLPDTFWSEVMNVLFPPKAPS